MNKAKWEEAKAAWTKIQEQAEIDLAQSTLYLEAIDKHLNSIKED